MTGYFSRNPTTILSDMLLRLWLAVALAGCSAGVGKLELERSWAQGAQIQATDGTELCVDLKVGRSRGAPRPLELELAVLDAEGRPVPSAMPELANERGELVVR